MVVVVDCTGQRGSVAVVVVDCTGQRGRAVLWLTVRDREVECCGPCGGARTCCTAGSWAVMYGTERGSVVLGLCGFGCRWSFDCWEHGTTV